MHEMEKNIYTLQKKGGSYFASHFFTQLLSYCMRKERK